MLYIVSYCRGEKMPVKRKKSALTMGHSNKMTVTIRGPVKAVLPIVIKASRNKDIVMKPLYCRYAFIEAIKECQC